jgi:hypothetical protein
VRTLFFTLLAAIVSGGCAGGLAGRLVPPQQNTLVRDQLTIHSDFPVAAHHRLFEELVAERNELCRQLGLPCSDEPIHVYLFDTAERFEGFIRLHYPQFPNRRAFFVETDATLAIYAQWGDRMADDLRHEAAHAYLHAVVPNVPLWLDEGLAKYYEAGRGQRGVNRTMLDCVAAKLKEGRWRPDLRRLEQFPADYNMTKDDYAEAWAWVHFLMESRGQTLSLLQTYLSDLRRNGAATPISARLATLIPQPDAAMIERVRQLAAGSR